MPKQLALLLAAVLAMGLVTGCSPSGGESSQNQSSTSSQSQTAETTGSSSDYLFEEGSTMLQFTKPADSAEIAVVTTSMGEVQIMFFPEQAPKAVENFTTLAKKGYYNGLRFHRVIDGFMIQGGDPSGNGTGGPGYSIKGEFSGNDFAENTLAHTAGVISMARAMDPDSAGSQFFIMHKNAPHLDGQYAAFGKITEGMDIVDKIATCETDWSDAPLTPVVMKTVTVDTFGETYPEPEKC